MPQISWDIISLDLLFIFPDKCYLKYKLWKHLSVDSQHFAFNVFILEKSLFGKSVLELFFKARRGILKCYPLFHGRIKCMCFLLKNCFLAVVYPASDKCSGSRWHYTLLLSLSWLVCSSSITHHNYIWSNTARLPYSMSIRPQYPERAPGGRRPAPKKWHALQQIKRDFHTFYQLILIFKYSRNICWKKQVT